MKKAAAVIATLLLATILSPAMNADAPGGVALAQFIRDTLEMSHTDFTGIQALPTGAGIPTHCRAENAPPWTLDCELSGFSGTQGAAAAAAVEKALPTGFTRTFPASYLWTRHDDYTLVMVSVVSSVVHLRVTQYVKLPPAGTRYDGSVTPLPLLWEHADKQGKVGKQLIGGGIVVAEDAQHSYVIVKAQPWAAKETLFLGDPVVPGRWRIVKPDVRATDESRGLILFATPRLRVKPAAFAASPARGQAIRVLAGSPGHEDEGDWMSSIDSDSGVVSAVHVAPPAFEYTAGTGSSWPGAAVVDAKTNALVGFGDNNDTGASGSYLAEPATVLAALTARANVTPALVSSRPPLRAIDPVTSIAPSVARIETSAKSVGTGVVVANTATTIYVLTASHVLKTDEKMAQLVASALVSLPSFKRARVARVVRVDIIRDLALLAVADAHVDALPLATVARRGERIAVIGFPESAYRFYAEGTGDPILPKWNEGILSSIDDAKGTIEYDAITDVGNSGGPIVDIATKKLVGLVKGEPALGTFAGISLTAIRAFLASAPLR